MTSIVLGNAAWQIDHDRDLVLDLAERADVLAVVEARTRDNRPLDVGRILGPGWDVAQDLRSAATSGCALAIRRGPNVTPIRWKLGTLSLPQRRASSRVQHRYLLNALVKVDGKRTQLGVNHWPLEKTDRQDDAERVARRWISNQRARRRLRVIDRFMLLGDFNSNVTAHARRWNLNAARTDVMGALWSAGWGPLAVDRSEHPWTDHGVLTLTTTRKAA